MKFSLQPNDKVNIERIIIVNAVKFCTLNAHGVVGGEIVSFVIAKHYRVYYKSGMTPVVISRRATILLKKAENKSSKIVAQEMSTNLHSVELWCNKYRNRIPEQTIYDILNVSPRRGRKEE